MYAQTRVERIPRERVGKEGPGTHARRACANPARKTAAGHIASPRFVILASWQLVLGLSLLLWDGQNSGSSGSQRGEQSLTLLRCAEPHIILLVVLLGLLQQLVDAPRLQGNLADEC